MANHRPKSLSELNNVYDKAMRAERAIKEGSDMLSIPEPETAPETENIFEQLENKAAEAHKNQVFDPDITDIANDFLKRFTQPEKPKAAPQEIKRPAPSIQVYHTPVKEPEKKAEDVSLNMGNNFATSFTAPAAPVHKPAHDAPSTDSIRPQYAAPVTQHTPAEPEITVPQPQVAEPAPVQTVAAAAKKAPEEVAPVAEPAPKKAYDHTPRPAPTRVRITSTERSELMEEYMRVMSDDDDEPSSRKSMFSFFKKKKKYDDESEDATESINEENQPDDSTPDEISVVPFDSSEVKYEDEYSDSPEEDIQQEPSAEQESMNLYDYIEADFDYDAEDAEEYTEDDEDGLLDVSFMPEAKAQENTADIPVEEPEYDDAVTSAEAEEATTDGEAEDVALTDDSADETVIIPAEEAEEEQNIVEADDTAEDTFVEAPPSDMVFEDIFSVTDESKRSHTGGNWTEVFGETLPEQLQDEAEEVVDVTEETDDNISEAVIIPAEEADFKASEENELVDDLNIDLAANQSDAPAQTEDDTQEEYDDYDAPKKRTGLKIIMSVAVILCILGAGLTAVLTAVVGVDSGKLISDRYRAFSVSEDLSTIGLNKGDLVITENIYAQSDMLYVFENNQDGTYGFGKINSVSGLTGDYIYVTETKDGVQLINRDTSMGVIISTYSGIGSVLSVICDYGIFIIIALAIFAIALIACLVIITRKRRLYEEAAAIYDHMDNSSADSENGKNSDNSDNSEDSEDEYYDYDTDGIEQGLFTDI